jgi:glycosyltransferase involved in cell wall biosynthesis
VTTAARALSHAASATEPKAEDAATAPNRRRVLVVGAGTRFLSGMSYYTIRVANALAAAQNVSVITIRQMIPTRFYPGRARVGSATTRLRYAEEIPVLDGIDWFWIPSLGRALSFMRRERPEFVLFQWWTGAVLHSYLALAILARSLGAKLVVEFHEVLDTGEAKLPFVARYVGKLAPILMRVAHGFVIHSEADREVLTKRYGLSGRPVATIPLGPFDHHASEVRAAADIVDRIRPFNLLFFGVIRPFKGLEDLIQAFDGLTDAEVANYWLTVVGETWEDWTIPGALIASSRHRERMTFINRYASDEEVAAAFSGADAVVLPYHRSSASGPLHTAMSHGLPVVVTDVGGLPEAVAEYGGAILVPPRDVSALRGALRQVAALRGMRFQDPHSWARTAERYDRLFAAL